jgi:hypothetical protein
VNPSSRAAVHSADEPRERRWRRTAQAAVLALFSAAFLLAAFDRLGWVEHLGVPPMAPPFADLRVITAADQALREGLDPMRTNPGDPWGRPMNYPRVWLLGARLGLTSSATPALAALLWFAGAAGLAWVAHQARTRLAALVFALAVLSPVSWFALERANTDLVMFGLLAGAAAALESRTKLAATLLAAAAALKLFPVFALAALASSGRRSARRLAGLVGALFAVYLLLTLDDLALIAANTQHWPPISYGVALAPRWIADNLSLSRELTLAAAYLACGGVFAAAAGLRRRVRIDDTQAPASTAAFRIGASVYVGSFLLGSNFDYRLLFLLFTLPRLCVWARVEEPVLRRAARFTLGVLLLMLWSSLWRRGLARLPAGDALGRALDEGLTWSAWCALATGLILSAPPRRAPSAGERVPHGEPAPSVGAPRPGLVERRPAPRRAEPTRAG